MFSIPICFQKGMGDEYLPSMRIEHLKLEAGVNFNRILRLFKLDGQNATLE